MSLAKNIIEDLKQVLKKHIETLRKAGYDDFEINDILEEVFDSLQFQIGEIIMERS